MAPSSKMSDKRPVRKRAPVIRYGISEVKVKAKKKRNNSAPIMSLNTLPSSMDSMPMETISMILERSNVETLKNAARVQKRWRSYIEPNQHRMKQTKVLAILIKQIRGKYTMKIIQKREDDEKSIKPLPYSAKTILKYWPTYLIFELHQPSKKAEEPFRLSNHPMWWCNSIKEKARILGVCGYTFLQWLLPKEQNEESIPTI